MSKEALEGRGSALRERVPRSSHAAWSPPADRADPVALLSAEDEHRVAELVPLRYQRMLASPFAFLRGAAVVMAHDLATAPATGLRVEAAGDAHLANFGLYGTPERNLIFDLNDFDETLPAPWEWDVKRLAASAVVAGRTAGRSGLECQEAARAAVQSYREHIRTMAAWTHLEVWYAAVDATAVASLLGATEKLGERAIARTRAETGAEELAKLTATPAAGDAPRFVEDPPLVVHETGGPGSVSGMDRLLAGYAGSLEPERRVLLGRYRLVDAVRKVVGVGSVGTRCAAALLLGGAGAGDALFLQVKEASASVLEPAAGRSAYGNHGERVVRGQRLCQAASDLFLGWVRGADGRDYSVRQLHDMKRSVDATALSGPQLASYASVCGWVLARSHARSGDPVAIAAYLGNSDSFDRALVSFAEAYADQNERDHAALAQAVRSGRIAQ
ncbi:MAG TPA: DUF2252 domain-containing protein [Actinomycetota bacterium]|nr:DUF2252 domain-containing protein [Actinomycetota bacterium]